MSLSQKAKKFSAPFKTNPVDVEGALFSQISTPGIEAARLVNLESQVSQDEQGVNTQATESELPLPLEVDEPEAEDDQPKKGKKKSRLVVKWPLPVKKNSLLQQVQNNEAKNITPSEGEAKHTKKKRKFMNNQIPKPKKQRAKGANQESKDKDRKLNGNNIKDLAEIESRVEKIVVVDEVAEPMEIEILGQIRPAETANSVTEPMTDVLLADYPMPKSPGIPSYQIPRSAPHTPRTPNRVPFFERMQAKSPGLVPMKVLASKQKRGKLQTNQPCDNVSTSLERLSAAVPPQADQNHRVSEYEFTISPNSKRKLTFTQRNKIKQKRAEYELKITIAKMQVEICQLEQRRLQLQTGIIHSHQSSSLL